MLRLAVAMFAGVILVLNRDLKDKPAGVRTHGLVALGSALVVLVSAEFAYGATGNPDGNPVTRTIQGVIAGVGFLGASVIIKVTSRGVVRGLTTAATIWLAACLGVAAGAGLIGLTAIAMGLTLFLLLAGGPLERVIRRVVPMRRGERRRPVRPRADDLTEYDRETTARDEDDEDEDRDDRGGGAAGAMG